MRKSRTPGIGDSTELDSRVPVAWIFRRRVIVCQEWVEMVTDYLEGALPPRLDKAVADHLAACPHCREYLDQMRRTIAVSHELTAHDVPADVVDALARAFADYRRSES